MWNLVKWLLPVAILLPGSCLNGGCAALIKNPLQDATAGINESIVKPMVEKVAAETTARAFAGQLGVQGINPGVKVEGQVVIGQCVMYDMTFSADGVAGQLSASAQGDAGQAASIPPPTIIQNVKGHVEQVNGTWAFVPDKPG